MPEGSNGHDAVTKAGLLRHFRFFPWQTQVALVFAMAGTFVGVPAGLNSFLKLGTTVAEIQTVTAGTSEQVTLLSQNVETLNNNMSSLDVLMTYYVCENEADEQWFVSLGEAGARYCAANKNKLVSDMVRDVWSER